MGLYDTAGELYDTAQQVVSAGSVVTRGIRHCSLGDPSCHSVAVLGDPAIRVGCHQIFKITLCFAGHSCPVKHKNNVGHAGHKGHTGHTGYAGPEVMAI